MTAASLTFGIGVLFGLALAVPPGPINAIIAEETLLGSFRDGVKSGAGAMSADLSFFVLAVLGVGAFVLERPLLQAGMIGIGGVLMLVFGFSALREALGRAEWRTEAPASSRGFWKTFVLSITNPYQLAFWLTVGVALIRPDRLELGAYLPVAREIVVETGHPTLFVGFFTGIAIWIVSFPAALRILGDRIDRFAPAVAAISALVLLGFGGWFLIDSLGALLI